MAYLFGKDLRYSGLILVLVGLAFVAMQPFFGDLSFAVGVLFAGIGGIAVALGHLSVGPKAKTSKAVKPSGPVCASCNAALESKKFTFCPYCGEKTKK